MEFGDINFKSEKLIVILVASFNLSNITLVGP